MVKEVVEKKLYDAASKGDVTTLEQLLQEDPYLVHETPFAYSRNLLHVAAMHGQAAIVEEVLKNNSGLATSLDSKNSSSLHIAAAQGSLEIAKKLLSVAPEACWWRDCHDMNPIHIAAMNGHVVILEELLKESTLPAMERLHRGQTVFHLCVKHGQLTTLKVLVRKLGELVSAKDDDGETLLHLAVRSNQLAIVEYLVECKITKTQTPNSMGKTELKILLESPPDTISSYSEIHKILKKLQDRSKWEPVKLTDTAMVVVVLIASMAFQVAISPPGGVWQDNKDGHVAGQAIMVSTYPSLYNKFLIHNTIAFVASLTAIFLIITGLPSRHIGFFYLAMNAMWLSILFIGLSYADSIKVTTAGDLSLGVKIISVPIYIVGLAVFLYMNRRVGEDLIPD